MAKKTEKQTKEKGFSYLEIVLAFAIFAYIILAFAQLFINSSVSVKETEFKTIAYNYGADYIEEIKSMGYASISTSTWSSESEGLGQVGKVFTRQAVISEIDTGLKQVSVTVTWTDITGTKNIELTSCIADY